MPRLKEVLDNNIWTKSQERWLQSGLEFLSVSGAYGFKIDDLCRKLNTAKSSFYYLFESKREYVYELARYWAEQHTYAYESRVSKINDAKLKFDELLVSIFEERREVIVWMELKTFAEHDDRLEKLLIDVEIRRMHVVATVLVQLGMKKREANETAYLFMHYFLGWLMLHRYDNVKLNDARIHINKLLKGLNLRLQK